MTAPKTSAQPTPGPWEISGGALRIFGGGEWIATVEGATPENGLSPTPAKALANARLIASAPTLKAENELLRKLLKECADRFERCCIHSGSDKEFAAAAVPDYRAALTRGAP